MLYSNVGRLRFTYETTYDNYCFASKKYGKVTMYNSNIVLYFVDNYVHNDCEVPDNMIDDSIQDDSSQVFACEEICQCR